MNYPSVICPRCKGTRYMRGQEGKVPDYKHNKKGRCFACEGEGTLIKRPDGKLVRRDLDNGNWLSYNPQTGVFLGVVEPLNDLYHEEDDKIYYMFKLSEEVI